MIRAASAGLAALLALALLGCAGPAAPSAPQEPSASSSEISSEVSAPPAFDPALEWYYDYFQTRMHVSFLFDSEGVLPDQAIAAYLISDLIRTGDYVVEGDGEVPGVSREIFDAAAQKYFGRTITQYDNRLSSRDRETDRILSTGWGGTWIEMVLKTLVENPDGSKTAVFYYVAPPLGSEIDFSSLRQDMLSGRFEPYGQAYAAELTFEHIEEDGETFLRYHSARSLDAAQPPYVPYGS